MAVAITINKISVFGDRKAIQATLVFSSNYATGGEAVTAANFGLNTLELLMFDGVAVSTDVATATAVKYNSATGKIVHYESGGAINAALAEKTNAEAYPTGSNVRALAIGF